MCSSMVMAFCVLLTSVFPWCVPRSRVPLRHPGRPRSKEECDGWPLLVHQEDGSQVQPSEQSDIYSFGGIILQVLRLAQYHIRNDITSSTSRSHQQSSLSSPLQRCCGFPTATSCLSYESESGDISNALQALVHRSHIFGCSIP